MNRLGLGLAVGAGYVLGRTKKMKLAFAVGTMVAGKRMHLSPRALADLVSTQLQNNPQFKEIGDQLRGDLRGVGKAATGALVERQITGLADRLHGRTSQVQDQLAGVVPVEVPDVPGVGGKKRRKRDEEQPDDEYDDVEYDDDEYEQDDDSEDSARDADDDEAAEDDEKPRPRKRAPAKKTAKAPAKKAAEKGSPGNEAPAKKTAAKAAKKAPGRKTAAAKTATRRTTRARTTRGGGDDD
ncbi:DNA primase [Streptomyces sp. NPDC087844]|uniref:DNA primase n=1 Tax=Streptomyces sp. NPDC087844 TaxID=3365805 RepID=UPI0037F327FC